LLLQHQTDLVVRNRKITLRFGIAGLGGSKTLFDGKTIAVRLERLIELALRKKGAAYPRVGDCEVALPAAVGWVDGCKPLDY
jgi:hypothetical protein